MQILKGLVERSARRRGSAGAANSAEELAEDASAEEQDLEIDAAGDEAPVFTAGSHDDGGDAAEDAGFSRVLMDDLTAHRLQIQDRREWLDPPDRMEAALRKIEWIEAAAARPSSPNAAGVRLELAQAIGKTFPIHNASQGRSGYGLTWQQAAERAGIAGADVEKLVSLLAEYDEPSAEHFRQLNGWAQDTIQQCEPRAARHTRGGR